MIGNWDGPDEPLLGQRRSNAALYLPRCAAVAVVPVQISSALSLRRLPAPELLDGGCKLFRLQAHVGQGAG